jgi:hypothetical protein
LPPVKSIPVPVPSRPPAEPAFLPAWQSFVADSGEHPRSLFVSSYFEGEAPDGQADYFIDIGCACLFGHYLSDESLELASHFFQRWIGFGASDVCLRTIANFSLHAFRFMRALRGRILTAPGDEGAWKAPGDVETWKVAIKAAFPQLTRQHVEVWRAAFARERDLLRRTFVRCFLGRLAPVWKNSEDLIGAQLPAFTMMSESECLNFMADIAPLFDTPKYYPRPLRLGDVVCGAPVRAVMSTLDALVLGKILRAP